MINRFLRIFFPELCPACKKPATDHKTAPICPDCWREIKPYTGNICQRCGIPLVSDKALTCGECIRDDPSFTSVRSFGIYEDVLKEAINLFKYKRLKKFSKPLSDLLFRTNLPQVDVIIPVSLHKKRLRQKEFNQSALIAKHVAKRLGIPLTVNCLVKIKDTMPQVGLKAKDRMRNVKKAFKIRNKELIGGKKIMLVDDVYTTGATVRECSKVLKKAGAKDIHVITLARSWVD